METKEDQIKKQALTRLKIIKGQLEGLQKLIEKDEYCINVLNQSLAIQNSLKSLDSLILERHLRLHVGQQLKTNKEKAIEEIIKIFKRKGKL